MKIRIFCYIIILIVGTGWGPNFFITDSHGAKPDEFHSLVSSVWRGPVADFCGEKVPMENQEVKERFEKELMLCLWDRPQVLLWLKRSRRYLPYIEALLKKENLPDDLKYIAIAESSLLAHAGSPKGAMGFWQFTPGTARKYGLIVDEYKDERRNFFTSTPAAIRYLKDLHQILNSWTLAAAAYNMGENRLLAEIAEQDTRDYYQLYLSLETQQYLFRILSVKRIFSDPEKYGFRLDDKDYYPALTFDLIKVNCAENIPIRIIARAGKTKFKTIKDLNPEIRGYYLAKGPHDIRIPMGSSEGFKDRYAPLEDEFLKTRRQNIHIVKKGENLSSIADKYGIPLPSLIIWNRIDINRPIHPGDRLFIYKNISGEQGSSK